MAISPVYISTTDDVVLTASYVIFYNLIPHSLTWDNNAQVSYYLVNATSGDIPFLAGTTYTDASSVKQTSLAQGASVFIIKDNFNNWIQSIVPGDIAITLGFPFILQPATAHRLGAIKVGSGLAITADGILSVTATGGGGGGGTGTVTSFSFLNGNGFVGTVNNPTTAPSLGLQPGFTGIGYSDGTSLFPLSVGSGLTLTGSTLSASGGGGGGSPTSMPKAFDVGILANGSDQTAALNTVLANGAYSGVIFDYSGPAAVTINGTLNGQGKVLRFQPGNTITGTGALNNFVIDCGLRQQCFNIGSSGPPSLTLNPIGTTLSVISPWIFGAKSDGNDIARPLQATVDLCIRQGDKISKIIIPSGQYTVNSPIIESKPVAGPSYAFHQITIEGETNFSEASGYGTTLYFGNRKDSFGFGIQGGKGSAIKNIKLIGGFTPPFTSAYNFYKGDLLSFTDGVSRDQRYSPNSAIVIDPFGPSVTLDGGWPGNDAYGNPLSGYYFGGAQGSTGVEFEDVFVANWVVGFICSPTGQTQNAEIVRAENLQFSNLKICIADCQDQEKLNVFRGIESWGVTHTIFASGVYGAGSVGNYYVEDLNIAGPSNQIVYNNETGYYPSYFTNVYAESLGRVGTMSGSNAQTFMKCTLNFADYQTGSLYYGDAQVQGQGINFIACQLRMYNGNFNPITINAVNGPIYFRDCSFDTVPFYNQDYPVGYVAFSNCITAGAVINPMDGVFTVSGTGYSQTYAYGNGKVKISGGNTAFRMNSGIAGIRFPINRNNAGYVVNTTVVSGITQTTITLSSDEANRIHANDPFGDIVCADTAGTGQGIRVMGIATVLGGGNLTIKYLPPWVVSGQTYFLYLWAPLPNIAFKGDITSGSNQITNVTVIAGDAANFLMGGVYDGFMVSKALQQTDGWGLNTFRLTAWNGSNTFTIDRNASASVTGLLFSQYDAVPDPLTPSISAGAGAGTGPTLSIVKGNDQNHQVSVLTGSGTPTGTIATVNLGIPFAGGYIPSVRFSPANANAAALSGATQIFMDSANTHSYTITSGSSALANTTTYLWNVEVK